MEFYDCSEKRDGFLLIAMSIMHNQRLQHVDLPTTGGENGNAVHSVPAVNQTLK